MSRMVFIAINALLAGASFVAGILPYLKASGSKDGAGLMLFLGLCFGVSAVGFVMRRRLLVIVAAVPVIGLAAVFGLIFLIGGWAWGPSNASTVNLLLLSCILVAVFAILGAILPFRDT